VVLVVWLQFKVVQQLWLMDQLEVESQSLVGLVQPPLQAALVEH